MPTTVPLTATTPSSSSSSTQPSLLGKLARLFSRATRILLYKLTSFSSSGSRTSSRTDPESGTWSSASSRTSLLKVGKMPGYSSEVAGQSGSNQELNKTTTTMINTMSKQKSFRTRSSWNSDLDHDKEWERKKSSMQQRTARRKFVGRCSSDCTGMRSSSSIQDVDDNGSNRRARARSLTDEDLDELRGCIDLGFGGCVDRPDPELWKTFPALELCYAITHNFKQQQQPRTSSPPSPQVEQRQDGWPSSSSSSPVSSSQQQRSSFTSDDGTAGRSSSSSRSPDYSRSEVAEASSWQISSPGDGPQKVKNRLRHWARAVACTLQQQQQQQQQQCYAY